LQSLASRIDLDLGIHTFVGGTPMDQAVIDTSAPATYHINYVVMDQPGVGNLHPIKSPVGFDPNLLLDHDQHARGIRRNSNPSNLAFPHSVKARTLRCRPKTVPQQSLEQNGTLRRRRPVSFPRTLVLVALWLRSVGLVE
jgi:hypothetical protein